MITWRKKFIVVFFVILNYKNRKDNIGHIVLGTVREQMHIKRKYD